MSTKAGVVVFSEGYSLDYLIHAFFTFLAAAISFLLFFPLGFLITAIAISLLLIKSGVEIDVSLKKIRCYNEFFSMRFGSWTDLNKVKELELRLTNESQEMSYRSISNTIRTKTYDIWLIQNNNKGYEFHCFDKYDLAMQVLRVIEYDCSIPVRNLITEAMRKSKERMSKRSRR